MSHTRDHIIITSISAPVSFGDAPPPVSGKLRLWHLVLVVLLVGFVVGLAF